MFQSLFTSQREQLNLFFDLLPLEEVEAVFQRILDCKGTLFLTGVGKSGYIARKIAATLVSTGTKAHFLSPTEALHGDLGIVEEGDCFLALSKSGESEEILQLLPFLAKKGVFRIAVVSRPFSRMAPLVDLLIHLPMLKELCPYDLAPTTSTTAQLLLGDCLAIALMQAKGFQAEHFGENHPGGLLGKKAHLTVADLMRKGDEMPLCTPTDFLSSVLPLLSSKRLGSLLIVEAGELLGIFTDGDLRRALATEGGAVLEKSMEQLMQKNFRSTSPEKKAIEALKQMEEDPHQAIMMLPVLSGRKLVGLLQMHDIVQAGLGNQKDVYQHV